MTKFFNFIRVNAFVLMIVLLATIGVLIPTNLYLQLGNANNAPVVIYILLESLLVFSFAGVAILALALKKNKLANILIGALGGYLLFNKAQNFPGYIGQLAGDTGLRIALDIFALLAGLFIVCVMVLSILAVFVEKSEASLKIAAKYSLVAYLVFEVCTFIIAFIIAVQNQSFSGIISAMTSNLANPCFLAVIYFQVFDKELEVEVIKPTDPETRDEVEAEVVDDNK